VGDFLKVWLDFAKDSFLHILCHGIHKVGCFVIYCILNSVDSTQYWIIGLNLTEDILGLPNVMERVVLGVEMAYSDMWSEQSKYTSEDEVSENKMRAWM
jgi:hypothetical protein